LTIQVGINIVSRYQGFHLSKENIVKEIPLEESFRDRENYGYG